MIILVVLIWVDGCIFKVIFHLVLTAADSSHAMHSQEYVQIPTPTLWHIIQIWLNISCTLFFGTNVCTDVEMKGWTYIQTFHKPPTDCENDNLPWCQYVGTWYPLLSCGAVDRGRLLLGRDSVGWLSTSLVPDNCINSSRRRQLT